MTAMRILIMTLVMMICCAVPDSSAAPVPKEKPMLKCELKPLPPPLDDPRIAWEVVITNNSAKDVDIPWRCDPLEHFDLIVNDPMGMQVKAIGCSTRLSPYSFENQHFM